MDKIKELEEWSNEDIVDKVNELIEESNDLREAYHAEMSALGGLVNGLEKRIELLENATKAD